MNTTGLSYLISSMKPSTMQQSAQSSSIRFGGWFPDDDERPARGKGTSSSKKGTSSSVQGPYKTDRPEATKQTERDQLDLYRIANRINDPVKKQRLLDLAAAMGE